MAGVPASSHGGGTFNGGTITDPLTVNPSDDTLQAVQITNGDGTGVVLLKATGPGGTFEVNDDGDASLQGTNFPSLECTSVTTRANISASDQMSPAGAARLNSQLGIRFTYAAVALFDADQTRLRLGYKAAPADAALANSTFALWLDDTPAATKLMVKAKDSAGTVVTAAIALA